MTDIILKVGIKTIVPILTWVGTIIFYALKNSKNEKIRKAAEDIASVVERVYRGCTSTEKRNAFIALCKEQKVNVEKALSFLEEHIIPTSKNVNTYTSQKEDRDGDISKWEKGLE